MVHQNIFSVEINMGEINNAGWHIKLSVPVIYIESSEIPTNTYIYCVCMSSTTL